MKAPHVYENIIKPMMATWPSKRSDEQLSTIVEGYVDGLNQFCENDLKYAWREVRNNHNGIGWPTIKAFREAAFESRRQNQTQERAGAQRQADSEKIFLSQKAILTSKCGQKALREGCGTDFEVTCQNIGRLLDEQETAALISKSRAAENRMKNDPDHRMRAQWAGFNEARTKREAELSRRYLRG